jgi:hypothetical protein
MVLRFAGDLLTGRRRINAPAQCTQSAQLPEYKLIISLSKSAKPPKMFLSVSKLSLTRRMLRYAPRFYKKKSKKKFKKTFTHVIEGPPAKFFGI